MSEASRILVVDDEPAIVEMVETTLEEEGYLTGTASSIEEAVRVLRKDTYHCAVLDIYLPDGTGLELAAKIKELSPELPVIIMTGTPASDNISRSVDIEADAYLIKPVNLDNLRSLVKELI